MKIAFVTDSTAFLDSELKNHPDVYSVPLTIIIDEKEYLDNGTLSPKEMYEKLKQAKTPSKTSQPAVGEFQKLFEELSGKYDHVISVVISSKLSGTYNSSITAAQLVNIPVTTVDSKLLSYPMSKIIKVGLSLAKEGKSVDQIVAALDPIYNSNQTYVLIGSLEQLHRSGRMGGLQFFLGSALKVQPVVSLEDGKLESKERVRSEVKGYEYMVDKLKKTLETNKVSEVYVLYGLDENHAKEWKEKLTPLFPGVTFTTYPLGTVIGVHAGEKTIALSWFDKLN